MKRRERQERDETTDVASVLLAHVHVHEYTETLIQVTERSYLIEKVAKLCDCSMLSHLVPAKVAH